MSEVGTSARKRRWPWLVLAGSAVVIASVYVAGYFYTGTRLAAETTIAQVDVGGKTPDDAVQALEAGVEVRVAQPLSVVSGEQTFELSPDEIGLTLNAEESVAAAGGRRSWDPRVMLDQLFGGTDHPPVIDIDDGALEAAVNQIAEAIDQPVVEALIEFPEATPTAREPEAGLELSRDQAAEAIAGAYLMTSEPIELTPETVDPQVDSDGLAEAMTNIAVPAMSAPVTINVADMSADLPVTAYAPALRVEVIDGELQAVIDPEALAEPLSDAATGIGNQAQDAQIAIVNGRPQITASETGIGLDAEVMAAELIDVITESGEQRAVTVEATVVEPDFTTEDAEALGIKERVSTFTTNYPHADYRNINQGRAAEILNNTLIKPGETFSFNDTVGERTVANGFTSGIVINQGVFREELGGGVSQVVTTTYNAAFFAGLEDVEHHPHAFYIDRYPVGREATVYYGSLDLRFRNPFDTGIVIRAFINPSSPGAQGSMTVEMWGTTVYDIEAGESERRNFRTPGTRYDNTAQCVSQSPATGFDIDIYRHFYQNGQRIRTETTTANYQAADRVICGPEPG